MPKSITPPCKIPEGYRYCSKGSNCVHPDGPVLPFTVEYFSRNGGDRWRASCRACDNKRQRDDRKLNPERSRESVRRWERGHSEYKKRYAREYRKTHLEAVRQREKEYLKSHPEQTRLKKLTYDRNRRAKELDSGGKHTSKDIKSLYKTQKGKCWWCGEALNGKYHVDHRIPISKGGSNGPENLCLTCAHCNISKGAKMPWEWNGRLL